MKTILITTEIFPSPILLKELVIFILQNIGNLITITPQNDQHHIILTF
jgi:hypothetical protein